MLPCLVSQPTGIVDKPLEGGSKEEEGEEMEKGDLERYLKPTKVSRSPKYQMKNGVH